VFEQASLEEMAENAKIPVINALSERYHPSQAFADFFTLQEQFGNLSVIPFAYVGDGNNMCHSLMSVGARVGAHVRVATPKSYEPDPDIVAEARSVAKETNAKIDLFHSPEEAVAGAQAVYTDVWASMGQEEESDKRAADFAGFKVDQKLFAHAARDAVFMHCLPAHRGLEVSAEVIDSPRSVIYDEAENRLHIQKAILHTLLT
jgi:ornithine carbamoyltransferase